MLRRDGKQNDLLEQAGSCLPPKRGAYVREDTVLKLVSHLFSKFGTKVLLLPFNGKMEMICSCV
jgi:hypothetical protein